MKCLVVFSVLFLAIVVTHAAPQGFQREPVPSDVETIEKDIERDQIDQDALEPRNHAKRSYGYGGGYYGGYGYPYYYGGGYGYPYSGGYYGFGHGYPSYGGFYGGFGHGLGYYF